MSGEIAGAADIVTGAVIAQAVEPDTGEGIAFDEASCLNCGTTLVGTHCHICGQRGHVHRTLHAFGHDFLHSVLHFEGKIWRTLPMLFWNPGDLTRRYVHGERAKFVSPLALFLFSVFLTFAVFNSLSPADVNAGVSPKSAEQEYQADRKQILDELAKLEASKKEWMATEMSGSEWIDVEIARYQQKLKNLEDGRGKEIHQADMAARKFELEKGRIETEIARLEAEVAAAAEAGKPTKAIEDQIESEKLGLKLMGNAAVAVTSSRGDLEGWRFTDLDFPGAGALNAAVETAKKNPQLLLYKIQSNAYKYSWALIPISVPFVWLLFFWRRRFKVFDHAVFVTYSITFMMLFGIVCALMINFPATEVIGGLALVLYPPIHMYRHLHLAYQTSRFGAFFRMCLLSLFAMAALTLFAALVIALGVT